MLVFISVSALWLRLYFPGRIAGLRKPDELGRCVASVLTALV